MMLTDTLILVIALLGTVGVLVLLQVLLAARHDHVIAAAPKYQTLELLDEQIESKRNIKLDLDSELQERREAIANFADKQADLDSLERRLGELHTEWNQLDDRREELRELALETEEAAIEKAELESKVTELVAQFDALGNKLEHAQLVLKDLEESEAKLARIQRTIDELKPLAERLEGAEKELSVLERRKSEVTEDIEHLTQRQAALLTAVEDLEQERANSNAEADKVKLELDAVTASISASRVKEADLQVAMQSMEARKAQLDRELGRDPETSETDDQLKELRAKPPVLLSMEKWKTKLTQSEGEALEDVKTRLEKAGLQYSDRTIKSFHTAMKVNDTAQMAVLAGISGTGKSQLPRQYAAGMGIGFLQVPVQPRWDSPQDLMGFYNYIEKRYRPTDMARALYHFDYLNNQDSDYRDQMLMILLDEMNLARVEYYFSDFLSRLESRPARDKVADETLRKDAEIEIELPMEDAPRIFPGYNLLFAGTMNEDESTQSLSDKVVDRANVLRFAAPKAINSSISETELPAVKALSRTTWESWLVAANQQSSDAVTNEALNSMVTIMKEFQRPFGHRLGKSILSYVANYPSTSHNIGARNALADQVEMRLLPKLRGVEVDNQAFTKLLDLTHKTLGDEALAEAIQYSMRNAEDGKGQFVWMGVTRA